MVDTERQQADATISSSTPDVSGGDAHFARPARTRRLVLLAVFVCAACGLVYELALITLGSYLTGSSIVQTSLVIGFVMAAMGLGALAAKPLLRWPVPAFAAVELSLGLVGALSVPLLYAAFAWLNLYTPVMLVTAMLIGGLIGAEIPLLMALVQTVRRQEPADAVADLSAADYGGALVGGLAFPFVLLPVFGLLQGALVVGALNVAVAGMLAGWLFRRSLTPRARLTVTAGALGGLAVLGGAAAYAEPFEVTARQRLYRDPIVHAERSPYQEIVLTARPVDRWSARDVRLFLDGDLQFSSLDEHRYHESLVHPALAGGHRRVLVLGGGDGLALRELLHYPDVDEVVLVDLDPAVVDLARTDDWLVQRNQAAFDDGRVETVAADAFGWVRDYRGAPFDVVLVDLPDPDSTDTAKLYSVEFYGLVGRLLVEDGRMAVQAGSPFFAPSSYWSVVAAVEQAGLGATPYHVDVPSFGDWGFVLAGQGPEPPKLHLDDRAAELRFLTPAVLDASQVFPPDRIPDDVRASTLLDPVILDYQRKEWTGY
ncbi:MAG TPA: polyamine aminopropyltransferase [Acidimicrobiales bacterium]|nr:polyamine aminopropyltransferase [Acidimicrobiales bacterium]